MCFEFSLFCLDEIVNVVPLNAFLINRYQLGNAL